MTEGLEDHVVSRGLVVLDEIISVSLRFHHERVGSFADLALESLPEVGRKVSRQLLLLAGMEPGGQTAVMDEADTALTFATREQRVLRAAF